MTRYRYHGPCETEDGGILHPVFDYALADEDDGPPIIAYCDCEDDALAMCRDRNRGYSGRRYTSHTLDLGVVFDARAGH
jgi:hypothetical protein